MGVPCRRLAPGFTLSLMLLSLISGEPLQAENSNNQVLRELGVDIDNEGRPHLPCHRRH